MMHLTISSDNTLHFYQYLNIHVIIAYGQFLLLIDVPIQNRGQQLQIYEVFSLPVPCSNLPAEYKVNYKYIGVTHDEQRQLPSQVYSTDPLSMPMDSCTGYMHHSNPSQTCHDVLLPYILKWSAIKEQCSLVISHMSHTYVPIAFTSNLLIIASNPQTWGPTMTIICSDKATNTLSLQ